jgi:hypothetical protein
VGAHEVEEMWEVEGHGELLLHGDVPRQLQRVFLPRERMRMSTSDGMIRSSPLVWKRVMAYNME